MKLEVGQRVKLVPLEVLKARPGRVDEGEFFYWQDEAVGVTPEMHDLFGKEVVVDRLYGQSFSIVGSTYSFLPAWLEPRVTIEGEVRTLPEKTSALDVQVGGGHYKDMKIQPIVFIQENNLGFCEGNAIKYLCRHRSKNGLEDLKKARHYIDLLIEHEYKARP